MAKKKESETRIEATATPEPVTDRDLTPEQALKQDWPKMHNQIGRYITEQGRVRTGLTPSDRKKAQEILKEYGF